MDTHTLRKRVAEIQWFHTIDLGNGVVTSGRDDTPRKLNRIGLPPDLAGQTVLDVGAWDGFFSRLKRNGAVQNVCWPLITSVGADRHGDRRPALSWRGTRWVPAWKIGWWT